MKYTKELMAKVVASSRSISDVMRHLGLSRSGPTAANLKRVITRLEISCDHFEPQISTTSGKSKPRMSWREILVYGKEEKTFRLRRALLESGREHKCVKCSIGTEWQDGPLVLQIDHIDGDNRNNRPKNLRFLCPNCHSQTPNYSKAKTSTKNLRFCIDCGEEVSRTKTGKCKSCHHIVQAATIPSREILESLIWKHPATKIAAMFEVSDKAVTKWCKKYELEKPGPGYWRQQETK